MNIKTVGNYLKWIIKNCHQTIYERSLQPILKLSHVKYSAKHGHNICIIQVIGKNAFTEIEANDLISKPQLLKAFSHEDVAQIASIAESIKNDISNKKIRLLGYKKIKNKEDCAIFQQVGENKVNEIPNLQAIFTHYM